VRPRGLKPELIRDTLRGPEAPLFHVAAGGSGAAGASVTARVPGAAGGSGAACVEVGAGAVMVSIFVGSDGRPGIWKHRR